MKSYKLTYILFFLGVNLYSQVGINTDKPERALDINGNLKIRELINKTSDDNYNRILVTDNEGNIETVDRSSLKNSITEDIIEIKRLFYNSTDPIDNNKLTCGQFQFSFRDSPTTGKNLDIMLNLESDPTKNITTYFTLFRKWGDDDLKYYKSNGKTFNSTNYSTPQLLCPQLDINSTGEFYISYPNERNFYRVLFLARPNYEENGIIHNSYTITCEKF
ncbi:hypothetical protein [Empedobacter falsenii]|uniref:Uncharacterized protein n=1 Tax=Empedobacter falsenii TaxID=343874 RepID=A0AAW7DD48_9FLAO|nr:hypothetical protein [Empedobacter falsenii]MDM1549790.1 hypothetical protein [Empedobacter falsenii]